MEEVCGLEPIATDHQFFVVCVQHMTIRLNPKFERFKTHVFLVRSHVGMPGRRLSGREKLGGSEAEACLVWKGGSRMNPA